MAIALNPCAMVPPWLSEPAPLRPCPHPHALLLLGASFSLYNSLRQCSIPSECRKYCTAFCFQPGSSGGWRTGDCQLSRFKFPFLAWRYHVLQLGNVWGSTLRSRIQHIVVLVATITFCVSGKSIFRDTRKMRRPNPHLLKYVFLTMPG